MTMVGVDERSLQSDSRRLVWFQVRKPFDAALQSSDELGKLLQLL